MPNLGSFEWAQVLSTLALAISGTTAYFSFFRRGLLRPSFGQTLLLQLAQGDRLRLKPELTVHNPSSRLAVVSELGWEFQKLSDDSSQKMIWEENLTTVYTEEHGQTGTKTRFDGFPGTFFVSAGDIHSRRLLLSTEHAFSLAEGEYLLKGEIYAYGPKSKPILVQAKLRLTAEDVAFLKVNQLSPDNVTRRILVFFYQRGQNTNCFLRAKKS